MELIFNTRQSEINVIQQFRNSVKVTFDQHIEKLKMIYSSFDSIISKYVEDLEKEKKIIKTPPFCSECCILCYNKGEIAINSSSFHKICKLCQGLNIKKNLICNHCNSSVKITKFQPKDCTCSIQHFHLLLTILTKTENICKPIEPRTLPKLLIPVSSLFEFLSKFNQIQNPAPKIPNPKLSLPRPNSNLPNANRNDSRHSMRNLNLRTSSITSFPPKLIKTTHYK